MPPYSRRVRYNFIANLNRHEDQHVYSTYDSGPYMTTSSKNPSGNEQLSRIRINYTSTAYVRCLTFYRYTKTHLPGDSQISGREPSLSVIMILGAAPTWHWSRRESIWMHSTPLPQVVGGFTKIVLIFLFFHRSGLMPSGETTANRN